MMRSIIAATGWALLLAACTGGGTATQEPEPLHGMVGRFQGDRRVLARAVDQEPERTAAVGAWPDVHGERSLWHGSCHLGEGLAREDGAAARACGRMKRFTWAIRRCQPPAPRRATPARGGGPWPAQWIVRASDLTGNAPRLPVRVMKLSLSFVESLGSPGLIWDGHIG